MRNTRSRALKGIAILLVIGLLILAERYYSISAFLDPERIERWLNAAGPLAPLVFILLMAMAIVVSPLPSLPLDIAAGSFFGPVLGTLYAALGALIGADISFLIARLLGREFIENTLSGHINFCQSCSDKLLTKIVFLSRLLPIVSFDIISYGAGLTNMSLWKFSLATFFGMLPLTFSYVVFGSAIIENRTLAIIMGVATVTMFFLLPRLIERYNLLSLRKYFRHLHGEG